MQGSNTLSGKESQRWLSTAEAARTVLARAQMVTEIRGRESDIHEKWARLPEPGFHILTRAMADRSILEGGGKLSLAPLQLAGAATGATPCPDPRGGAATGRQPQPMGWGHARRIGPTRGDVALAGRKDLAPAMSRWRVHARRITGARPEEHPDPMKPKTLRRSG